MAKQTFTTGSVLTAAQMTSLQQTAMLGGAASAKVASYVLQASDAGTAISMSNAAATTITVNTGLFAAGDIVTILNVGAGTCTITAGTATVSKPTNATLALVTSAGGVLYFTATGAAIFMPFDVGSAPATSTKNFSLLGTGTLTSGSTVTVSGISNQDTILIRIIGASGTNAGTWVSARFNSDTGTNYNYSGINLNAPSTYATTFLTSESGSTDRLYLARMSSSASSIISGYILLQGCATAGVKTFVLGAAADQAASNTQVAQVQGGFWNNSATVTSVSLLLDAGTFDAGTFTVYGSA